jgi:eukaryotic-like serine/threonine-protein kinase
VLSEGQILDDTYRLLRVVGEGGMGVVYEATHARLAGRYAIKVLTERFAESPEGLEHFRREARITSLLQHPNVVQVIDHNTTPDGTEYLVMEYLAGESLSQRLSREGRLPLDAVIDIIDQIAAGLSAAHAHGIVHRDLKPDNVILVPVEGRPTELVKILDFGISKRRGSLDLSGLVCGTPQYMAPEQVEGRLLEVDGSTDQFALAVIAQEMLTGRNPFQADSVDAIFARIASDAPVSVGIGGGVDAVLARALAKSGRQRFRTVTDFSDAFRGAALAWQRAQRRRAAAPPPIQAPGDGLGRKPRSPRRGWTMALGATATAIAIVAVAETGPTRLLAAGRARSAAVVSKLRPDRPRDDGGQPVSVRRAQGQPIPRAEPAVTPQIMAPRLVDPEAAVVMASEQLAPRIEERASNVAPARRPARTRPTARPTTPRPRPVLPVDEDATMPPTEISDGEPGR